MRLAIRILLSVSLIASFGASFIWLPGLVTPLSFETKEPVSVGVEPSALEITCPGSFVQSGGVDGTDLGAIERIGSAELAFHSNGVLDSEPNLEFSSAQTLVTQGVNQSTDLLSANQLQGISRERAKGLMALDCSQPIVSGWFINGEAGVGRESILILSNPAPTEVTIEANFYAPSGLVQDRFTLAVGEVKLVSLAKYVLADDNFAIYFETDGVGVSAALQNRNTTGLTPLGVELVAPIPAAQNSILLPGLSDLAPGFVAPELVVFNPQQDSEDIQIFGTTSAGRQLLQEQSVGAGQILKLEIEIPEAVNGLVLIGSGEIVAGIKSPSLTPVLDFAWLLPANTFDQVAVIPNPRNGSTLNIMNPGESPISVSVGQGGNYSSLAIEAYGSLSIEVEQGEVNLQSAGAFAATLSLFGTSGYSVITPGQNSNYASTFQVLVSSGRGE